MERTQYQYYVSIGEYKGLPEEEGCLNHSLIENLASFQNEKQKLEAKLQELGLQTKFQEYLLNFQSIETGQIEGLYDLNQGITETLLKSGFSENIISHADAAGQDSELIIQQLQDQKNALEGLFAFVKNTAPLSLAYIRRLHEEICKHQDYTYGKDSLGNRVQIELIKGAWKDQPNNPSQTDDKVFHYCPPEQVQTEMDTLIAGYNSQGEGPSQALLGAAWMHHRFSLIHPFQDGNGRTARLLASLLLIRAKLYPFIVPRERREEYLDCLKAADEGELQKLLDFMLAMQKEMLQHGEAICKPDEWKLRAKKTAEVLKQKEFLQVKWERHPELKEWINQGLNPLFHELLKFTTQELHSSYDNFVDSFAEGVRYEQEDPSLALGCYLRISGNYIGAFLFEPLVEDTGYRYKVISVQLRDDLNIDSTDIVGEWNIEQLREGVAVNDFRDAILSMIEHNLI